MLALSRFIHYQSCVYHLVCIMYLCHMYANVFYPDACMNSSDCFWFCPLLLPPFLPFCPLHPSLFLPLHPTGHQQMGPPLWVGFCLRFLPVKREFFLVTVTLVLALGASGSELWKAPWDNWNCYWHYLNWIELNWIWTWKEWRSTTLINFNGRCYASCFSTGSTKLTAKIFKNVVPWVLTSSTFNFACSGAMYLHGLVVE